MLHDWPEVGVICSTFIIQITTNLVRRISMLLFEIETGKKYCKSFENIRNLKKFLHHKTQGLCDEQIFGRSRPPCGLF